MPTFIVLFNYLKYMEKKHIMYVLKSQIIISFKSKHSNKIYQTKKNLNCNSKMVVYLIEIRVCKKQCNGSTVTKFRARANNYKITHRNFRKDQILSNQARNQKRFHQHYLHNDHNAICDWEITIIDHAETVKPFRQKELYWYHKLKTYAPFGLNEGDVYAAYQKLQCFHSLDVINKHYCFLVLFSFPRVLFVISLLLVVIVIIIVKNDDSHEL